MWDPCEPCRCPPRVKRPIRSCLDKENHLSSPGKTEDVSFYGTISPLPPCNHNLIIRRPLEDHDLNSRDSGYNEGRTKCPPSPGHGSFELADSMEDDFFEDFFDIKPLDENLPQDFSNLISGPISEAPSTSPRDLVIRPLFRRALSLQASPTRVRSCLFDESRPSKRPEPPQSAESPESKKQKTEDGGRLVPSIRPPLMRAVSATEESIMCAVQKSEADPDLIGDFSKSFFLPLTQGRHQDLKSITATTLARLIRGEFKNHVASFKVIDCRYPYEYEGGHIDGAINLYMKEQCLELLQNFRNEKEDSGMRSDILVFHCEFSSERGPNLYRYLREQDRQLNQDVYPLLHYPEVYLLEGGYKNFFEHFSKMCVPIAYTEMLHPEYESQLRYFRIKCKTLNTDKKQRKQCRANFKRLEL